MKRARIYHAGQAIWAEFNQTEDHLILPSGALVATGEAQWLPPNLPGSTIFALGLNYADHTRELGFEPPSKPLIFLKGHKTFVGHEGMTPYPKGARQIHPECELVAIIGQPCRNVREEDALAHVGGYTIACDYAVREFLENYYRPNLRVKNRDATTPTGPWIVDAQDIANPMALRLTTRVNGTIVQDGSTADMVFSIAWLIAHLSSFMTLMPGDMILTGTPHGVHFCDPGDRVECEIENIGTLVNTLGPEPLAAAG
ncbi:MAG: fumarylacetoacetate hydrolase family protein [Hyphomonadaceae bacterium]|nr:fumarylacetoacetate hydrolase family protein [Hyphomonadaceae bacterium]